MEDRRLTASGAPQSRDLVRVAFGPSLVALIVIAAITLVQLVIANSDLTGTLGAVASMWLAVHLVPVSIGGQQLGVLPLAPAILMVWVTARATARITPPRGSWFLLRWIVASAVGGPLLIAAISLAVVHDAASVLTSLQTPNALRAFTSVLLVHGIGALFGVGSRVGARVVSRVGVPDWLLQAVRPALVGVAALLAMSSAVVALSLVVHWGTMHELFGITDSLVGQFSLTALSLLYLPNVVLGAAAVAVGSSAHIGFATFSAFTVFGGDIPALPILAAVSRPPLGPVWVGLLIVGAAAGVALGQQSALRPKPLGLAVAKVAVAAALASVLLALLAFAGSGLLGNFGHVGVDQATLAPGAFVWFFGVGALTAVMAGGVSARPPRAVPPSPAPVADGPGPEPGDEPDDEVYDEADERDEAPQIPAPEPEPEPDPDPPPPPPPVRPAPDAEDVEDLMFVDDDLDPPDDEDRPQPPAG